MDTIVFAGANLEGILEHFFFQAEDGIRDFHVTGVQTCALPIFNWQAQRMAQSLSQTRTVLTPETRQGIFRFMVGAANAPSFVSATGQPTVPACGAVATDRKSVV